MKTINSRVNRVTKLAPNRVTKKDVPRLVSLSAQTIKFQRPKIYVGDFARIVKKDEAFNKGYKQSFSDEVFEVESLATFNPPTYSLIDANGDKIEGKFYQPESQLVRIEKNELNRFTDEFTVHVISSASMEIFDSNTLSSFRNFFKDEIQLAGDWRVALSEIIFPTKNEHIVNGDMVVYSLKGYEDSQKRATEANVISCPYNGEKLSIKTETYNSVVDILTTIKRTVGLPNFSFREIKKTGKFEILMGKTRELLSQVKKFRALSVFRAFQMAVEYTSVQNEKRNIKQTKEE